MPTFNNTDDLVLIADSGITIDSVLYDSKWGIKSKSIERRKYFDKSGDATNWGPSDTTGTPTAINSLAAYYDLALSDVTLDPAGVKLIIENKGNIESLKGRIDILVNDILQEDLALSTIPPTSDIEIFVIFSILGYDPTVGDKLEIIIHSDEDIDIRNNSFDIYIPKSTKSGDVMINEIMYDVDDKHFEFIELYNNSAEDVQISNWYLANALDLKNGRYNQIITNINLPPNENAVIVCDEAIYKVVDKSMWDRILFTKKKFNLSSTSDNINIYNEHKRLIDSIEYFDTWHEDYLSTTKNKSLEKIRPTLSSRDSNNWKTCTSESGSTILTSNSYSNNLTSEKSLSVVPNPFAPNSASKPYALIEYKLPYDNALIDCDIFYTDGTLAVSLVQSKFTSSSGRLSWNGRGKTNYVLPIGPYVVIIEATDQNTGNSEILKAVIVLAQ